MAERRQAARREPIEVELQDGRVFTAEPLPWMEANDLGNKILQEQAASVNEAVRLFMDDNVPQLDVTLHLKVNDWQPVLNLAYPKNTLQDWSEPAAPSRDECADLIIASLEVNNLEHLIPLVDPNSQPPTNLGGQGTSESGTEMTAGPKIASIPDSSASVLPELTPLP